MDEEEKDVIQSEIASPIRTEDKEEVITNFLKFTEEEQIQQIKSKAKKGLAKKEYKEGIKSVVSSTTKGYTLSKNHYKEYVSSGSKSGFKDDKVAIWTWNINGINAVLTKQALQEFLDQEYPDIVCFNEIKIDDLKLEERKIKDYIPLRYKQYWNCCKTIKG